MSDQFFNTTFYFSSSLFVISGVLLLLLYLFRWTSNVLSSAIWLGAYFLSGLIAWASAPYLDGILVGIGVNLLLVFLLAPKAVPVISIFGLCFFVSMIVPSLFFVLFLFHIITPISDFFHAGSFSFSLLIVFMVIFAFLTLLNTASSSWDLLVRFSKLYFLFPRSKKAYHSFSTEREQKPWISIHLPCYAEPPEIVIESLNALAQLTYPNFEVLVIDNNTKDPALWRPLEEHCRKLGDRFKFFHFDTLPGAKAGALNQALRLTSPQASLIAVVDADYVAEDHFLDSLVGFFDDPATGYVQTCQDYRLWEKSNYLSACYYEYGRHFILELPGKSEWDVAYTVGTMCLLRRESIEKVGGWAEWCLTEDSEISIRLHNQGYQGYYLKQTLGRGLIPQTFEDFKIQRFRWCAGPVQQFQKHWRLYLPWSSASGLSFMQKMAEFFHSMSIFSSESITLLNAVPILGVSLYLAIVDQYHVDMPVSLLVFIPIIIIRNMICSWVQTKMLGGDWRMAIFSSIAARSLMFTRNMAFYKAWLKKPVLWRRTGKFSSEFNLGRAMRVCRPELVSATVYILIMIAIFPYVQFSHPDILFMGFIMLLNQTFSLLCAPILSYLTK